MGEHGVAPVQAGQPMRGVLSPSARHRLALALWLLAGIALLVSVAWWWVVYRQVVNSALISMPRALPCLANTSDLCALAQALCTSSNHVLGIRHYQAYLFWSGAALAAVALLPSFRLRLTTTG
jgi:hypothetical protein